MTFGTEADQVNCLTKTAIGKYDLWYGDASGSSSEANFQNGYILDISEAPEPNDILYEGSGVSFHWRFARLLLSYAICTFAMVITFLILNALSATGANVVALFVAVVNQFLPVLVSYTTNYVEVHVQTSDKELSALAKLAIVRCINSGVLIYLTASYNSNFGEDHLGHIQSILLADAFSTPVLRFLDIQGIINRNLIAPRVSTQDEMNLLYTPQDWTLSERYTDMIKTIFVGTFFAVPLPSGLFITAFTMLTTYWVDKYSLCRQWKISPNLDGSLATISRYVFALIIFAHVNVSKNYFANWPYLDSADSPDCTFFLCPTTEVMTSDQKSIVDLYNVGNIATFVVILAWVLFGRFGALCHTLFGDSSKNFEVDNIEKSISFRTLQSIAAYVPIVHPVDLVDPIIMSDVSNLPEQFLPLSRGSQSFSHERFDPSVFSVVNLGEFSNINNETSLQSLFTQVKYFEKKETSYVPYAKAVQPGISATKQGGGVVQMDSIVAHDKKVLPPGWKERKSPEGKVYYANSATEKTQWNFPSA